ncbi:DUF2971 domain-containing protein [Paludibacter sp.]|uniref:DUF2971 domain-containing protein n=1 Tax=Paludibacter sp. TaxID=1898105 RepID=UPI0013555CFF|nr:DUF2971 domain-containing protein [Paludibacter sp.]MTK52525.1 DUF2971 domain-containing protein [Paludibacter sp.]
MDADFKRVYNKIIYKYVSADIALKILNDKTLLFSSPDSFNDPLDCYEELIDITLNKQSYLDFLNKSLKSKLSIGSRSEKRQFINDLKNHPNKFHQLHKRQILEKKKSIGICCFSENHDNILLWSHYAQKHEGVCIGFLIPPVTEKTYILYPVRYKKQISPISCLEDVDIAIKHWLLTKAIDWEYEHEIRAISLQYQGLISISPSHIKEVYFGCKIRESAKHDLLYKLQKEFNHVKSFQMKINKNTFGLIPNQISTF